MRALASVLGIGLVLGAGCGFEREAPFAGARSPDVAPWQDVGPVTFCDGTGVRVAAPSLGFGGLCDTRYDTPACTRDDDCGSRERCVCSRCTVEVCDSAEECGGGFVCTFADRRCDRPCDADADCRSNERCLPGRHVCRGTCSNSDQCQRAEFCQASTGLCVATACSDSASCSRSICLGQRVGALLAEPTPLAGPGGVELYVERTDADGVPHLMHATGPDGLVFTFDGNPYIGGMPIAEARAPSFARLADGSFALVFEHGADLYVTRSGDGYAWSPATRALPNARQPSLAVAADGTPLLWVVDADGNITRFSGDADLVFSTPVVALTPAAVRTPLWPDVDALASPFADPYVDADGSLRLRLWFAAHGTESGPSSQFGVPTPTPPDWSIGVAVSTDGVTFAPDAYDPVFDRTTDFINHPSELDPAVVRLGDHWLLYYRRAKADGSAGETIAVARSPAVPR